MAFQSLLKMRQAKITPRELLDQFRPLWQECGILDEIQQILWYTTALSLDLSHKVVFDTDQELITIRDAEARATRLYRTFLNTSQYQVSPKPDNPVPKDKNKRPAKDNETQTPPSPKSSSAGRGGRQERGGRKENAKDKEKASSEDKKPTVAAKTPRKEVICYKCGEKEHITPNCTNSAKTGKDTATK